MVIRMIDGDNMRGRPYREWLDDIKQWSQKDIHLLFRIYSPRTKQMETGGKMFVGYLRAFSPRIAMMMILDQVINYFLSQRFLRRLKIFHILPI